MDYSVQRLQFLDLTDATDNDQSLIERILFSSNQALEVPWYSRSAGQTEFQTEQEWTNTSYTDDVDPRQVLPSSHPIENAENENVECGREAVQGEENHQEQQQDQVPQQEHMPRQGGIFPGHPPTSLPHQAQKFIRSKKNDRNLPFPYRSRQKPMFQMYQMLPSLSNVYVSNVTANVNVHTPYVQPIPGPYGHQLPTQQQQPPPPPPPQQMYPHGPPPDPDQGNRNRRQRQKGDKKRDGPFVQNEVISPSMDGHPPPQFPNIPPMPPYYLPGAPGAPVYMQHAILPVYPSPMFSPYSHTPGPIVYPQANNMEPGSEEYHDNVQQNFHQEGSDMVVVGMGHRSENSSDQRTGLEGTESNYQIEELPEQQVQEVQSGFKSGSENVHYHEGIVESQADQHPVPQQNGQHFENSSKGDVSCNCYDKKEQDVENKLGGPKQVASKEQTENLPGAVREDVNGKMVNAQKKKANGELDVNTNSDKTSVNNGAVVGTDWESEKGHQTVHQTVSSKVKVISCGSGSGSGSGSTSTSTSTSMSAQVVKGQDPSVPASHQNSDFPLIRQNTKVTRSPESEASPAPTQVTPSSGGKSWASLFNKSSDQFTVNSASDTRGRPLARVLPYSEVETSASGVPGTPMSSSPVTSSSSAKADRVKSNGPLLPETVSNFVNDPHLHNLGVFLSKYELEHKIVSLQPRGLTNRSNWCYVNAILQSLIACPPFYNLLKALPVVNNRKGNKQTLIVDALVEYANEFSPMPVNARIGKREKSARNKEENSTVEILTGPAFEPSGIYKILDKVRGESSFNVEGRQEDAEEFLSCLLNGLNDEMFELMKMVGANKLGLANGDAHGLEGIVDDDDTEWNVMGPKNKSSVTRRAVCGKTPVSDIFRGQFRSRVQRAGDQTTDTVQPFFTLQLDIEKANSVRDALELFMGKDPLEGVTCSRTHQEVEAWTQTTLEDLPLVLILHLKCYDYKSDACSKIIKSFDFQVDLKIDAKLLSNRNKYTGKERNYKLVAVVYHDGKEASKGHYVTDAYHVGYGCWLRYDDVIVRSVPESHVLKPRAPRVPYLLYYRRADTIGPTK